VEAQQATRTRDPEGTLQRLLDAALHSFAEFGYERATVDRIVQEAGFSKGAFYTHFSSKDEVFLELLERRLEHNLARVRQLCKLEGSAATWIKRVLETLMNFSRESADMRALSVEFMAHGMRRAEVGERISHMHLRWRQLFAETLRQSEDYRQGRMAADPEAIAYAMVAMVDGFILQFGMESEPMDKQHLIEKLEPLIDAWFAEG
jgi:AcrR family transcriptional regulator